MKRLSISSNDCFCTKCLIDMFPLNVIDDDVDSLNCIFNIIKGNTIDTWHIKNAQQLKLFSKLKPADSDIDPDKNFIESELSCNENYYCDQEFNDFRSLSNVSGRLSILHSNKSSLNKNMDNLLMLLQILTWSHTASKWEGGGGVALFVENSINFKLRLDLDETELNSVESLKKLQI